MRKYGFLAVEGPHDVELVYRLLRCFGLARVQHESNLDSSFLKLIPKKYPPDGDLQKRVPIPLFLQSDTHVIAIRNAGGDSQLIKATENAINILDLDGIILTGLGILLDSDKEIDAAKRYRELKQNLAAKGLNLPEQPGIVTSGPPKLGAFVLPDNQTAGTLEDLLLDSALTVYPNLLASATSYIDTAITSTELIPEEREDFDKPAGRNKAIVGAMAGIMRPGKSIQVSIQDNRWFRDEALRLPRIKAVQDFLKTLFELDQPKP
ncbi:DUF3226 domain-containing protein [Methylomagnum ishizawai]|uniref:DUF3226 domain-containing protein n=1 Tax=Methylomagnum ishizawai TaxID=1760988 RepID=UPI001C33C8EA|nr:DUF3226 domain-containing protein [Methylomagnum ishizawai]BBL76837.1 hypothetical protein MishRS11D_39350 [Methylomagnum ishizawai]